MIQRIKSLEVNGLNYRFDYNLEFNEDMNVLTGLNGSGKTTLLKLLWYLTSGNLHRIISEIPFALVDIETSWFNLSMEQESEGVVTLEWKFSDESQSKTMTLDSESLADNLGDLNKRIAAVVKGSRFFPTFRRCELGKRGFGNESSYGKLQDAMSEFSKELSVQNHKFIITMSTGDIDEQLIPVDEVLKFLQGLETLTKQSELKKTQNTLEERFSLLWNIAGKDIKKAQNTLEERFLLLREIVADIYNNYEKIIISADISFEGKGTWEISPIFSEGLSSGEKQLLGFLCHNAFSVDPLMFLDEPELSLHIDYQRLILPLLVAQGTEKQFFVATHSPFIYSRYDKKEINLEENTNE